MHGKLAPAILVALCAASVAPVRAETMNTTAEVRAVFSNPPRGYSSGPLWVWNDMLTEQQIVDTMRDLAGQKVRQVWVHPRPGLMTPYLSDDWFRLWKVALNEAERLDMNVWIYDENSYPSGFAGGFVPEAMPESRGRGLALKEEKKAPAWSDNLVGVFRLTEGKSENVTAKVRAGESFPDARYLIASLVRAGTSPWYGGKFYVDLMYPGVTEKFLTITMDAYKREIGGQFGKRTPGVFTDEPELRPAGGLPWTDDLPQVFEKRWGYSLLENLPCLHQPVGDWKRVRHNYYQVLLDLFIDRWARPYYEYCEKNNLEFTGHYWEHEWPNCGGVPDNMAMSAWQQRPGIDTLMNQYHEDTHAQFGNVRAVKELCSVANQLGRARTLCEAYGAGGWDLRFEDMKRIGDWLYVLGVNTLNEHLSYVTLRGARKRDHPQSFSYHEPWWEAYHVSAAYFTRLSLALSTGKQINDILLIEPTTTAWMYHGHGPDKLGKIGQTFQNLVVACEKAQVEYDIGCEDVMARHGSLDSAKLRIGQRSYRTVVLPPMTENLNTKTADLLEGFLKAGGVVLCCGPAPEVIEAVPSDRGAAMTKASGWKQVQPDAVPAMLLANARDGFAIRRSDGDKGILFHHRRQFADGELLFLVNTSIESPSSGAVTSPAKGVEQWDLETGKTVAYPFEASGDGVRAAFELPPSGSLLLHLSGQRCEPAPKTQEKTTTIAAVGQMETRRVQPNVLVLDYVDVTAGGETKKDIYFYQASQFAFQKNGMERNPWDSAVQFRDELITKTFPAGSGFEASYSFTIEGQVPADLTAVIERPDLYTITCNGQSVSASKDSWWLDKAFGKITIAPAAKVGRNVITIKASPFTIYHEIESACILGDFSLKATDHGFAIVPPQPLKLGKWNEQGHPFYSAGVSYVQKFEVPSLAGTYCVSLPGWYGSVAKVVVNGKPAGYIGFPPWRQDVTSLVQAGANTIEVTVIGTLKNTLGPHHGNPPLGSAWPGMFQKGPTVGPPPGEKYSTVGYGLFEPFVLLQAAK